jgi:hypothetical protein
VLEDPRDLDNYSPLDSLSDLVEMSYALRARGMQRQADGDMDTFPRLVRGGLAAARTARNLGGLASARAAHESEDVLLAGVAEWMDRLDGRPDLLRGLLVDLSRHDREMPVGSADAYWAEQVILRNTMDRVGSWLPTVLGNRSVVTDAQNPQAEAETNLVAVAWTVPWERARRERLLRLQADRAVDPAWLSGLQRMAFLRSERADVLAARDRRGLALRRFARLEVALRLYQLDHGRPAADLAALVPAYVTAVPEDPYGGRPFGYRLSAEREEIGAGSGLLSYEASVSRGVVSALANPVGGINGAWAVVVADRPARARGASRVAPAVPQVLVVPAGYGVLWSVGPDGRDNGGTRTGPGGTPASPGDNWVILVPPVRPSHE